MLKDGFPYLPGHRRFNEHNTTIFIEKTTTEYRFVEIPDYSLCLIWVYPGSNKWQDMLNMFSHWSNNFIPGTGPKKILFETKVVEAYETLIDKKHIITCPLCSEPMLERHGKFGKFYACSAWPETKCPGILNAFKKPNIKTKELMAKKPKSTQQKKDSAMEEQKKKIEFEGIDMLDI